MTTTAMKSLRRSTNVDAYSAPLCVRAARGNVHRIRFEECNYIGHDNPRTTMVNGTPEEDILEETAIPNRIAAEEGCCENRSNLTRELAIDLRQVVTTPQMQVNAVMYLRTEIRNGFEKLMTQGIQYEQNALKSRLYTREELAEHLSVGLTTLDTMRQDPTFPCIYLTDAKNRGSVRFDPEEVLRHLRRKSAIQRDMAK